MRKRLLCLPRICEQNIISTCTWLGFAQSFHSVPPYCRWQGRSDFDISTPYFFRTQISYLSSDTSLNTANIHKCTLSLATYVERTYNSIHTRVVSRSDSVTNSWYSTRAPFLESSQIIPVVTPVLYSAKQGRTDNGQKPWRMGFEIELSIVSTEKNHRTQNNQ